MTFMVGILLLVGGIVALRLAGPKNGKARAFTETPLITPVVLAIVLSIGVGIILTIGGMVS
jgi:hypothetical protein